MFPNVNIAKELEELSRIIFNKEGQGRIIKDPDKTEELFEGDLIYFERESSMNFLDNLNSNMALIRLEFGAYGIILRENLKKWRDFLKNNRKEKWIILAFINFVEKNK